MKRNRSVIHRPAGPTAPAVITAAGKQAARRFLEFFTVNIRNRNTRAAYARAAGAFLRWCETRAELAELHQVQPVHVAAYIEALQAERLAPTVKQHLACRSGTGLDIESFGGQETVIRPKRPLP